MFHLRAVQQRFHGAWTQLWLPNAQVIESFRRALRQLSLDHLLSAIPIFFFLYWSLSELIPFRKQIRNDHALSLKSSETAYCCEQMASSFEILFQLWKMWILTSKPIIPQRFCHSIERTETVDSQSMFFNENILPKWKIQSPFRFSSDSARPVVVKSSTLCMECSIRA